ncbi:MAG: FAD-dependent oxidoreductase [Gammaproteobacteria bacterium]|nr:FAD-dependent oxidoreductase [Gammaproteobacteria bacterium]
MTTRRQVLKGAGAAAVAGLAGASSAVQARDAREVTRFDHETDIICVGGGAAALTAAAVAAHAGRNVTVLEKGPVLGGTTARSGGVFWIPNHYLLREKGITDARDDALRYMCRYSFPERYDPASPTLGLAPAAFQQLEAFYDNGHVMVDHLREIGALEVRQFGDDFGGDGPLDYFSHMPENKTPAGRPLVPALRDGSGGNGFEMISQLEGFLEARDVPILTEHAVKRMIMRDGAVVGVEVEHDGSVLNFRAKQAVIFGTGGYANNADMVLEHQQPFHYGTCASVLATGDLLPMAQAAGVSLGNMGSGWRTPVVFEEAVRNRAVATGAFMQPGDSMFEVNKYGKRIVNERRNYNDRTRVHQTFDPNLGEYPNLLTFYIYDQRTAEAWAGNYPLSGSGRDAWYTIRGDSLEELTSNIQARLERYAEQTGGVRLAADFAEQLAQTRERFNTFARKGRDEDFGRGDQDYDRQWMPFFAQKREDTDWPDNDLPNPTMYPLRDEGPYFCIILAPGFLDTNGGPVVNHEARMVDGLGQPIPGLFGAGNCVASPARAAYYGAGGTLGLAMTYGYIAAQHASREPVRDA